MQELDPEMRYPVDQVLSGMEIHPLDKGWTALEALFLIKCIDSEGQVSWAYRTTHRLNREELLGAMITQTDLLRRELLEEWESE